PWLRGSGLPLSTPADTVPVRAPGLVSFRAPGLADVIRAGLVGVLSGSAAAPQPGDSSGPGDAALWTRLRPPAGAASLNGTAIPGTAAFMDRAALWSAA